MGGVQNQNPSIPDENKVAEHHVTTTERTSEAIDNDSLGVNLSYLEI